MVPQLAEQFKAQHPGTTFDIAAEGWCDSFDPECAEPFLSLLATDLLLYKHTNGEPSGPG